KRLEPEAAENSLPVAVKAQVTHLQPHSNGIYIFDGNHGILVDLPHSNQEYEDLRVGSIVKVSGRATPGGFLPTIDADKIQIIDWAPLPESRKLHLYELSRPSSNIDANWVSIQGRITDIGVPPNSDYIVVNLEHFGLSSKVLLPYSEEALKQISKMLFHRVFTSAVAETVFNQNRQMTGRRFLANSIDDLEINNVGEEWLNMDIRPIEALMRANANYQKAMHTRGTVTYCSEDRLFVRGDKASLKVITAGDSDLQPGDYVDLLGFIWPQPISPAFRARDVTVLEKKPAPKPRRIDLNDPINPNWNYELVEIDATLIEFGESFGISRFSNNPSDETLPTERYSLLCSSGNRIFEARLPIGAELTKNLQPGAELKLVGISNLVPNREHHWQNFTESLWLEVRPGDGLTILKAAPWWTTTRLLWMFGTVLTIAGLFFIWIILLRKHVSRQTLIIGEQIERESILSERQRIARELHDTLEQGLAGMALHLNNCSRKFKTSPDQSLALLQQSAGMLRFCREESRNSILELRGGILEKMDLADAIQQRVESLSSECSAEFTFRIIGNRRRLNPSVDRHLLRVATEAMTNSAHHANASKIEVELNYSEESTDLRVSDDGIGFEVDRLQKSERFGLQGMRERANRLEAELDIMSTVGHGTVISLSVPNRT
ncbi:MAG: sensor histidine kinase, partial [Verrucomicrobiota bacterium]